MTEPIPFTFLAAPFAEMRDDGEYIDVTLAFGEQEVPCHKVVLAARSEYFRGMFQSNFVESASKKVEMQGIRSSTGVLLVRFLYTGDIDISMENAEDLLAASEMLLLASLKEKVEQFLRGLVNVSNCISLLNLSRLYNTQHLLEDAQTFLNSHIKEITESEELEILQEEDLIQILTSNDSQEDNFRLLQQWAKSGEGRSAQFVPLVEHIKLSQCSREFILNNVMSEKMMVNERGVEQAMLNHPTLQAAEGNTANEQLKTLVVGDDSGDMWMSADNQQWQSMQKPPSSFHDYSACASPKGFVVSGGRIGYDGDVQRDCYEYDAQKREWQTFPPMNVGRRVHSSIVQNDQLYVIGGRDGRSYFNSVEKLDMRSLQWSRLSPLPQGVESPYVVFASNNLLVLGGFNGYWIKDVYQYDSTQNKWQTKASMPETCSRGSAVSFGDDVYVVGGWVKCFMRFTPSSNTWTTLQQPRFNHYYGPSVVWRSKILICGGLKTDSIEEYCPESNEWTTLELKMPKKGDMIFALLMNGS